MYMYMYIHETSRLSVIYLSLQFCFKVILCIEKVSLTLYTYMCATEADIAGSQKVKYTIQVVTSI